MELMQGWEDASARSVMANLAAVQAPSTHRKAGGMKQTKVSAADPCGQAADPGGNSMVEWGMKVAASLEVENVRMKTFVTLRKKN